MTYFEFLFLFLVLPLVLLLSIQRWEQHRKGDARDAMSRKPPWLAIAVQTSVALVYTTPWDNYLVATGVWFYNPALVTGITLGYVPLEEYTFFILEPLLVGMWWWFLARRLNAPAPFSPSTKLRIWPAALLSVLWLISVAVFLGGPAPLTYLSITLLWAIPPIAIQCAFGADILWHHRKHIMATVLPLALFLSAADSIAITAGTWTISPAKSTGLFIGALPVEEALFFFITVMLATFGLTLMRAQPSQARVRALVRDDAQRRKPMPPPTLIESPRRASRSRDRPATG
jgi:lycopene cyclase domain-containing protein